MFDGEGHELIPVFTGLNPNVTRRQDLDTLGFNLSSALVNMANVPMIVAPYLKGKYAEAAVARALGDASKVFLGSGTNTKMPVLGADGRTTMMKVMPSIANYDPNSAEGKKYATLIRIADERGQLNRSQLNEILQADLNGSRWQQFKAMSGWMLHHAERMNREVTMVATYNLELERLRKENQALKQAPQARVTMKVSDKGGLSVYGLGRFPVTLYKEQWIKLLGMSADIERFIREHDHELKTKE